MAVEIALLHLNY